MITPLDLIFALIAQTTAPNSDSQVLITVLISLLSGSFITAGGAFWVNMRREKREALRQATDAQREAEEAPIRREGLIADAAERAMGFMNESLAEAKQQLAELRGELKAANEKIDRLEQAIHHAQKDNDQIRADNAQLRAELERALRRRIALERELAETQDRIADLEARGVGRIRTRRSDPPRPPAPPDPPDT